MTGNETIDRYAVELTARLPRHAVDEVIGGLEETYADQLDTQEGQHDAAKAAIAEFGDVDAVVRAFVRHGAGRQVAQRLITSGVVVGITWAAALIAAAAWTWPIAPEDGLILAGGLWATVTLLFTTLRNEDSLSWSWLAPLLASLLLTAMDATMIIVILHLEPSYTPLLALAMSMSALRIVFATSRVPGLLRHRYP